MLTFPAAVNQGRGSERTGEILADGREGFSSSREPCISSHLSPDTQCDECKQLALKSINPFEKRPLKVTVRSV